MRENSSPVRQERAAAAPAACRLSMEDVEAQYAGQWVLLKVTDRDAYDAPSAGEVVAHGPRRRVIQALRAIGASGERPEAPYALFAAGAFVRPGTAAMLEFLKGAGLGGSEGA